MRGHMEKELLNLVSQIENDLNLLKSKLFDFLQSKEKIVENNSNEIPTNLPETQVVSESISSLPEPVVEIVETPQPVVQSPPPAPPIDEALNQFISNPAWVAAVPQDLICDENNHEDKMDRARGVRDLFNFNFSYENKKVLDYGTGYGHLVEALLEKNVSLAVGYDVVGEFQIQSADKKVMTSSWDEVVSKGPYDLIFLYDVIDHVIGETPQEILIKAKSVLSDSGIIKMRCHPFISKHGGHLYNKVNKAYAHLVLSRDEMIKLGHDFKNYPTVRVTMPIRTYNKYIEDAQLKIVSQSVVNEQAEKMFLSGDFGHRIKTNLGMRNIPIPQMGMQFLDYTICK